MRGIWFLFIALVTMTMASPVAAYDAEFAKKAEQLLSRMDQKTLSTSPCKIPADKLLEMIRNGEKVYLLDVRTPAEMGIIGLTWKNTLEMPLDKLFAKENLDKLPKDGKIVAVCHSGNRASAAAVMLRAAGVDNVVFLNGGLIALTQATTPVSAP